jgi:PAS domain S-box-containing protein
LTAQVHGPSSSWPADPVARETLLRAPLGICRVGSDLRIEFANPALALILGFASPQALAQALDGTTIFHPESVPDSIDALAAGRLSFEAAEVVLRSASGDPVLARVDGSIVSGDAAETTWVLFIREAGLEKERDIELARTLSELENTMQTIPDILYTLDVEARLVRWNRKMETATGYAPEELRLKPAFELFPEEEKPTFARAIMDAFASGYAEFETRLRSRDGSTIAYQWTAVPLEDAHRNVVGLAGAGRDISEWKRNEGARAHLEGLIRKRAREWQITFDAIDSPIVLADRNGRIARINQAARDLVGDVDYKDIVGKDLTAFADRQPWAAFDQLARGDVEDGATISVHDTFSGKTWEVSSYAPDPETDEAEPALGIVIARDVTRMHQLQETARKNEVMSAVGQLIVGVAHEVRNPIFGISATLDAFEASFPTTDESKQFMDVLRGEIGRLSRLMQELLDYGRPTRTDFTDGSLVEVAALAARACELTARRANVAIQIGLGADLPAIRMDRLKLVQVFQNLLDNAIQFSPPETAVTLTAEIVELAGGPWAAISVLDRGRGFHHADIDRIFEPFFTRRRGGTGLGLSIVQRIVEEHGGRIEAQNRDGGGARMTVFLPLTPAAAPAASR